MPPYFCEFFIPFTAPPSFFELTPTFRVISVNEPYTTSRGEAYGTNGTLVKSGDRIVTSYFMEAPSLDAPHANAGAASVQSISIWASRARQRISPASAPLPLRHHHARHQPAVLVGVGPDCTRDVGERAVHDESGGDIRCLVPGCICPQRRVLLVLHACSGRGMPTPAKRRL